MEKMVIRGGTPLTGSVTISGSKNAALPVIISSIMAPGTSLYRSVPDLMDIHTTKSLLEALGADVREDADALAVDSGPITSHEASWELVRKMRASFLVMGALIARFRQARVSLPGGCMLGVRPVDQHLKGFTALGVSITEEHGIVIAEAKRLRGNRVVFDFPTVGATENVMMAAAAAKGETVIENAAREPEIIDLARALSNMGAVIEGAGDETIHIQGVESLSPIDHTIIPDRIEAGTFLLAAAITGGDAQIYNYPFGILTAVEEKLKECGVKLKESPEGMRVSGPRRPQSTDFQTLPYPGFPTDLQAPFTSFLSLASGTSIITENIFEQRFAHIPELVRLGADISIDGRTAVIRGVKKLSGAKVMSSDLRNSAALILAGLAAENTTEVYRIYHLDRGYERIEKKLSSMGADIERTRQDD
ncbi:MAG: UDP-N-acetylglucosamine 1-carboxyvinyltransferase [Deltaproteobacteria bacterium]|nr:UDP-N-acetylglucosamine 1-carboxyvinyltransferase [Candidatus Zymogenaceae bacterium]